MSDVKKFVCMETPSQQVERGLRAVLDDLFVVSDSGYWIFDGIFYPENLPRLVEIFQKAATSE